MGTGGGTIVSNAASIALRNLSLSKVQFGWVFTQPTTTAEEDLQAMKELFAENSCLAESLNMLYLLAWRGPKLFLGLITPSSNATEVCMGCFRISIVISDCSLSRTSTLTLPLLNLLCVTSKCHLTVLKGPVKLISLGSKVLNHIS